MPSSVYTKTLKTPGTDLYCTYQNYHGSTDQSESTTDEINPQTFDPSELKIKNKEKSKLPIQNVTLYSSQGVH